MVTTNHSMVIYLLTKGNVKFKDVVTVNFPLKDIVESQSEIDSNSNTTSTTSFPQFLHLFFAN